MTADGIISAILIGAVIGALGRLVLPGRQSMPIWLTIVVGIIAALLGSVHRQCARRGDNRRRRLDRDLHPGRFSPRSAWSSWPAPWVGAASPDVTLSEVSGLCGSLARTTPFVALATYSHLYSAMWSHLVSGQLHCVVGVRLLTEHRLSVMDASVRNRCRLTDFAAFQGDATGRHCAEIPVGVIFLRRCCVPEVGRAAKAG